MPRRLLRDHRIVVDDWRYAGDPEIAAGAAVPGTAVPLILNFAVWLTERARWEDYGGPLGVLLAPAHAVEQLAPDLARFACVAAEFPGPSEGRGYTQGRLLRERYRFAGELRATGHVGRDQLFFLARCGFNSFELPEAELEPARAALATFSAAYQSANDAGLAAKLARR
jgi:uncharacterized protein (DUF934 family)